MVKIRKQAKAEEDLKNIWLYSFETWGEQQADWYYDELVKGMNLLARNPDLGTACDDIRTGYRSFKIKRHVVFYKITPTFLSIVRVLHERMDSQHHLIV